MVLIPHATCCVVNCRTLLYHAGAWVACIVLLAATPVMAEDKTEGGEIKVLSGMSLVGSSEAPKSLTFVPWEISEIGTSKTIQLTSNLLIEELSPIDRGVFMRELDFYKLSNPN